MHDYFIKRKYLGTPCTFPGIFGNPCTMWLQDESDVTQTVIFLHWKHLRHQNLSKRCRSTMRSRQVGVKTVDVPLFPSWTAPGPKALKRVTRVRKKTVPVSNCAVNCLAFILETSLNSHLRICTSDSILLPQYYLFLFSKGVSCQHFLGLLH